jgi:hypothetical protein
MLGRDYGPMRAISDKKYHNQAYSRARNTSNGMSIPLRAITSPSSPPVHTSTINKDQTYFDNNDDEDDFDMPRRSTPLAESEHRSKANTSAYGTYPQPGGETSSHRDTGIDDEEVGIEAEAASLISSTAVNDAVEIKPMRMRLSRTSVYALIAVCLMSVGSHL